MKIKIKYLIIGIFIIFLSGFICGRVVKPFKPKEIQKTQVLIDKTSLIEQYKKSAELYLDSANSEMSNFAFRYYYRPDGILPNHYNGIDDKTVLFTKENFFYYYSMFKITEYLSKSKTEVINSLILTTKDTI